MSEPFQPHLPGFEPRSPDHKGPLVGMKVLDIATMIAAPTAATFQKTAHSIVSHDQRKHVAFVCGSSRCPQNRRSPHEWLKPTSG